MVHDTVRGGQDDETELTGRQEVGDPLFHFVNLDIVTGGDDTTLVKTTVELDNNLSGTVIIDDLEFTNVTYYKRLDTLNKRWIDLPCFCMTVKNLTTTLETGRTRTWRFPRFSAL